MQPLSMRRRRGLGADIVGQPHQPVGGDEPVGRIGARRRERVADPLARREAGAVARRLDHAGGLAAEARGQAQRIEAGAMIGVDDS